MKKFLCFLVSSLLSTAVFANFGIAGSFYTGSVHGFVQTPAGGQPGTSSEKRPTYAELGINHNNNYIINAWYKWKKITVYAGYHLVRLYGSNVLQHALITHNVTIPKGTNINSTLKFDWYNLGGSYDFSFLQDRLIISPLLEIAVLDFRYAIDNYIVPRQYHEVTPRFGVYAKYIFNRKLFLSTKIATSIPKINLDITTANLKFNYKFLQIHKIRPIVFAGIGYTYIDFKDHQTMPNHVQYIMNPAYMVGFRFNFC